MDKEAKKYIESVRDERRKLFERLQALILASYPKADLVRSYGIAAYKTDEGWIGLGYRSDGVTIYTRGQRIKEFEAKHQGIKTSKGGIQLTLKDKVTDAALRSLFRSIIKGQSRR